MKNYSTLTLLLFFTSLQSNLFSADIVATDLGTQKTTNEQPHIQPTEKSSGTLETTTKVPSKKKKLVIFISKGGAGHLIACDTLQTFLSKDYDINVVTPIQDLLNSIDPVKMLTFGNLDAEGFYNKIIQNQWIGFANWGVKHIAPSLVLSKRKTVEKKVTEYLKKEKPDLVISLIPFLNRAFANAAQECNLPFLLITLEADLTNWMMGMHKITHQNYAVTIGSNLKLTHDQLAYRKIPSERIHNIGYPIRESFFGSRDKDAIYKEWNIPKDKFIIMLLMGGAGSYSTYRYAKKIAAMNLDTHILVCTGRNTEIADKIKKLKCTPGVSMTIIPFTKKIADLMAISNLFITKPGPGSINESVQMKLPMLLDGTSTALFWEQANMTLVKEHGWGEVVYKFKDLEGMIKKFVTDKKYYGNIKQNLKKQPRYVFNKKLKQLIKTLIKQQPSVPVIGAKDKAKITPVAK